MALSTVERRLAESHRQVQARLAAATIVQLQGLWRLLDPSNLTGTSRDWLEASVRVITAQHGVSAALARQYIRSARSASIGAAPAGILPTPGMPEEAVRRSLLITGPVRIERAGRRGMDIAAAANVAFTETARSGSRHVLNGGRQTITAYAQTDQRAGWARITSGNACTFCQMLAGRGAVYSQQTVDFQAHDGCHCAGALEFRR